MFSSGPCCKSYLGSDQCVEVQPPTNSYCFDLFFRLKERRFITLTYESAAPASSKPVTAFVDA